MNTLIIYLGSWKNINTTINRDTFTSLLSTLLVCFDNLIDFRYDIIFHSNKPFNTNINIKSADKYDIVCQRSRRQSRCKNWEINVCLKSLLNNLLNFSIFIL
jgi:hypothetical protein